MKQLILFALLALTAPAAFADTYYMCGCTNLPRNHPGYSNRANWLYERAWTLKGAQQRRDKTCFARFGRRAPLLGACLPVKGAVRGGSVGRARRREESIRNAHRGLDEVIRRNREDEIDRLLKEARECRMYGNCPGR
jgi:hypothetical protein